MGGDVGGDVGRVVLWGLAHVIVVVSSPAVTGCLGRFTSSCKKSEVSLKSKKLKPRPQNSGKKEQAMITLHEMAVFNSLNGS